MVVAMVESPQLLWALFIVVGVIGSVITLGTIIAIFIRELRSGKLW